MVLIFAYLAGLLTLVNPCVLPILPIVLATATRSSRFGPLALAAGMGLSFVVLGMGVSLFGHAVGISEETVASAGATLMIGFGLVMLVPQFSARFATVAAGFAGRADARFDEIDRRGVGGLFLGGTLLGAVWSPCIGPTLGGAIGLASQGESIGRALAIMVFFALGVGTIIVALAYGAQSVIARRRDLMRNFAERSRPILGLVFVLVGLAVLTHFNQVIDNWVLDHMPDWLIAFSVIL